VRVVDESPLIVPIEQLAPGGERDEMFEWLHELVRNHRETLEFDRRVLLEQFELTDVARKVVGVAASARARGSRCCSAATAWSRGSCRSKRRRPHCARSSWARASSQTMASESSPDSE
jgi:Uncharacterized protein conserved in bacteria (DUF2252)